MQVGSARGRSLCRSAGLRGAISRALPSRIAAWIITAFLALNTLGDLMSASPAERHVMTPLSLMLCACFAMAAAARRPAGTP
jgi:hypothetical protein